MPVSFFPDRPARRFLSFGLVLVACVPITSLAAQTTEPDLGMMAAAIQHAETTFAAAPVFEERARRGTTVLVPTARHARLAGLLEAATGAKVLPEGTEVIDCTDAGCAPAFDGLTITRVGFESDPGIADGRPLFWVRWLEPSGGRSVATRSQALDLRLEGSTWVVGAVLSEGWATMIPRPAATGARDGAVR